ncbi:MAG: hypothetical protein ACOZQL_24825 [Myxococcota bacterium]
MATQSFTFFFMTDAQRATDRSQEVTWSNAKPSSSAPVQYGWVKK